MQDFPIPKDVPPIPKDPIRRRILDAITKAPKDVNLKSLSLELGRNHAYLHQFIYRGTPKTLPEFLRHGLAQRLGIHEAKLRPVGTQFLPPPAPSASPPAPSDEADAAADLAYIREHIRVERFDHPSQKDAGIVFDRNTSWHVPSAFLGHVKNKGALKWLCLAESGQASVLCMIDTGDVSALRAGAFALDMGETIRIRHLEQISQKNDKVYITGMDEHPYMAELGDIVILGRVIFKGAALE